MSHFIRKPIDQKFHMEMECSTSPYVESTVRIVKTSNQDPIPDDEPLFLLRARDYLTLPLLKHYRDLCVTDGCTDYHLSMLDTQIKAFENFSINNPSKMKQPGVTRGL